MIKVKLIKSEGKFFKEWASKEFGVRILFDKTEKGFYKYQVQKLEGRNWCKVKAFHSFGEAKAFVKEVV